MPGSMHAYAWTPAHKRPRLRAMGAGTVHNPVSGRPPGRDGAAAGGDPAPARKAPAAAPLASTSRPAGGYHEDGYAQLTRFLAHHPGWSAWREGENGAWLARDSSGLEATAASLDGLDDAADEAEAIAARLAARRAETTQTLDRMSARHPGVRVFPDAGTGQWAAQYRGGTVTAATVAALEWEAQREWG
jgi:hypothetical protein